MKKKCKSHTKAKGNISIYIVIKIEFEKIGNGQFTQIMML